MGKSLPLLLAWALLLLLLAATVGASFLLTGLPGFTVAMAIALAKAALVYWYFMHLREEGGLVRLAALFAAAWLLILLLLTGADYLTR